MACIISNSVQIQRVTMNQNMEKQKGTSVKGVFMSKIFSVDFADKIFSLRKKQSSICMLITCTVNQLQI